MNVEQRTVLPFLAQEEYLESLIRAFLETKRAENVATGTLKFYKQKLTSFKVYCLTQEIKTITQISPFTIREYLLFLRDGQHNDGGVHPHFRSIRTLLRWYEREFEPEGWKNPVNKVKLPKVALEPLEPVDIDHVQSILAVCGDDLVGRRDTAMLNFLLDSCVRASELLAIRLDEINLITGECLIKKGKGRKPRMIYFGDKCRRLMRRYLKQVDADVEVDMKRYSLVDNLE